MLLKLTGMALVLFSTTLAGIYFSKRGQYRIEDLGAMKQAITLLGHQISFLSMPLPEGLAAVSHKVDGGVGHIFAQAAKKMEERTGEGAEQIWEETLTEGVSGTYFSGDDMEALFAFGKTLGYLDHKQQLASIDLLLEYIRQAEERLEESSKKNGRLYCSMGVLSGLLVIVLLL